MVITCELQKEGLFDLPLAFWLRCQETLYGSSPEVPISEDRAWVILQNYRMKGVVHYFAAILSKSCFRMIHGHHLRCETAGDEQFSLFCCVLVAGVVNLCKDAKKKPDLSALDGLAAKWEDDKVGVINFETMRPNARVLELLLHRYLPDAPELRTINVYAAREEDPVIRKLFEVMNHYFEVQPDVVSGLAQAEHLEEGEEEECKEEDEELSEIEDDGYSRQFVPVDELLAQDAELSDDVLLRLLGGGPADDPEPQPPALSSGLTDEFAKMALQSSPQQQLVSVKEELKPKALVDGSPGASMDSEPSTLVKSEDSKPSTLVKPNDNKPNVLVKAEDGKPNTLVKSEHSKPNANGPKGKPDSEIIDLVADPTPPRVVEKTPVFGAHDVRLKRIEELKCEISKRRRTLKCPRPLTSNPTVIHEQETQVENLSPVARSLAKQFEAVSAEQPPPESKPSTEAAMSKPSESQSKPSTEAAMSKLSESQSKPSTEAAEPEPDDLFHCADPDITRKRQFQEKQALKLVKAHDLEEAEDEVAIKAKPEETEGGQSPKALEAGGSKPSASAEDKPKAEPDAKNAAEAEIPENGKVKDAVKEATPDGEAGPKPKRQRRPAGEPKQTFACRPCPKMEAYAKQRFVAIRDSYELHVKNLLKSPSTHEDAYWRHCFDTLKDEIEDKKGTNVVHDVRKICEKCAKTFLALEPVQGFLHKLVWVICCCVCLLLSSLRIPQTLELRLAEACNSSLSIDLLFCAAQ
ncbi:unnamed protein product [Symbiodinium sp. CCMP2456]|nr:unnamed protein product [Symbiodinium sp. CCMP2456]